MLLVLTASMRSILPIAFFLLSFSGHTQKIDSIFFHLYTDSLKKGVYNYINVDARLANGRYLPLSTDKIKFSSSSGTWDGNSLIIDPDYKGDSVWVKADLIENPALSKSIIIYLKKNLSAVPLKTEQEILDEIRRSKKGR